MKHIAWALCGGLVLGACGLASAQDSQNQAQKLPVIHKVEIGKNAELLVNGKPFFPLMLWLQSPNDFALEKELNVNTIVGYDWDLPEGDAAAKTRDPGLAAYAEKAWNANLYFVPSFRADYPAGTVAKAAALENVLGWIQGDEPDMSTMVSDATVTPAENMNVNPSTPFFRIVDGDTGSWTVLEPMAGGEFTIHLKAPVTVQSLAVWLTISKGLAVGKDVVFSGDGQELLKATLENKDGQQKFDLKEPATFQSLTVRFTSQYPGDEKYGSVSEVQAFDKDGKDVLLSKPHKEPRVAPEVIQAAYRATKAADAAHPVFMNLTSDFMKSEKEYDQATKDRVYPAYARGCDVLGFDTYPIFGAGYFGKILEPAQGTAEMRPFAKPGQPLYAWIETNRGSKWITPAKQPEVKPEHTRFETWGCIINGATGIAYFTHKWVDPDGRENYMSFAPKEDPAMQAELKRLNAQITRLSSAILADAAKSRIEMKLAGDGADLPSHFKATRLGRDLYIFAQNTDLGPDPEKLQQFDPIKPRAGNATISVEGLKAGAKIEVVDENRSIAAEAGKFSDDFAPLTEHVYKIRM
jgi:hypothetical protein